MTEFKKSDTEKAIQDGTAVPDEIDIATEVLKCDAATAVKILDPNPDFEHPTKFYDIVMSDIAHLRAMRNNGENDKIKKFMIERLHEYMHAIADVAEASHEIEVQANTTLKMFGEDKPTTIGELMKNYESMSEAASAALNRVYDMGYAAHRYAAAHVAHSIVMGGTFVPTHDNMACL